MAGGFRPAIQVSVATASARAGRRGPSGKWRQAALVRGPARDAGPLTRCRGGRIGSDGVSLSSACPAVIPPGRKCAGR